MNLLRLLKNKVKQVFQQKEEYNSLIDEFNQLAVETKANLTHKAHSEVYQKLAHGVYYIYGMGVKGDIAEFGTMTGRTAVVLAAAVNECSHNLAYSDQAHGFDKPRQLYLFDSFEGLPDSQHEPDKLSPHVSSGVWGRGTCKGLTPQRLLDICSKYLEAARIHVIQGWFKDTVNISLDSVLALVHTDGDLYESAIDALNPLFERKLISEGAIVFFDDWNCNRADPMYGEKKAWAEMVAKYNIEYSDEGSYGISGHHFIIHRYC